MVTAPEEWKGAACSEAGQLTRYAADAISRGTISSEHFAALQRQIGRAMAECFRTPSNEEVFTVNWVDDQCVVVVFGLEGRTFASVDESEPKAFLAAAELALELGSTEQQGHSPTNLYEDQ